ncbi:hypothetical protein TNCT6_68490 [Streptomyces sp. 6-11-2]|nr:hypothetical protein TNCT6_68490 [Streptomyces sp. 6-11-2]
MRSNCLTDPCTHAGTQNGRRPWRSRHIQERLDRLSPIEYEKKCYADQATAERANLTVLQPAPTS